MSDFNLALLIVAIVVCVLVLLTSVYLLVNYQHPDDKNQAYFPKFVVILGISISIISILMLPADVANRQACRRAIYNGSCSLTLPMKDLWLAVYIADAILVFFVIPFAMFYYEGDQDKCGVSPFFFPFFFFLIELWFGSAIARLGLVLMGFAFWHLQDCDEEGDECVVVGGDDRGCLCAGSWHPLW